MIREAAQLGFFDAEKRLAALSAKGDPLEAIDRLVPWESFRADIEAVVLMPDEMRKSNSGRKPVDAIVMFRMLVLQARTIFRTSKRNIRRATGCHLRGFCGWASRTAFRMRRRCGCSGRNSPRLGSLKNCLSALTSTLRRRATWRMAGR